MIIYRNSSVEEKYFLAYYGTLTPDNIYYRYYLSRKKVYESIKQEQNEVFTKQWQEKALKVVEEEAEKALTKQIARVLD